MFPCSMGDCVGSIVSLWCTGSMNWHLGDHMLISDLTASTMSADTQVTDNQWPGNHQSTSQSPSMWCTFIEPTEEETQVLMIKECGFRVHQRRKGVLIITYSFCIELKWLGLIFFLDPQFSPFSKFYNLKPLRKFGLVAELESVYSERIMLSQSRQHVSIMRESPQCQGRLVLQTGAKAEGEREIPHSFIHRK